MTYAPASLLDLRAFLTPITKLSAGNLGIVGDARHAGGGTSYHLGKDQLTATAYSRRTARDKAGLTDAASALDIGNFPKLRALSVWLVKEAQRNAPGTDDMREIIYSPDGKTVYRWDRERGHASAPRTGEADDSHLWHTHISWYRDSEWLDKIGPFRGFFTDTQGDDDMPLIDFTLDPNEQGGTIKVKEGGASVVTIDGGDRPELAAGMVRPTLGPVFLKIRDDLKHYVVFIGTTEIGFVSENEVDFTPAGVVDEDAVLAARREGYDLARAGFGITHPAPTVTWPPRP